jgi:predicted TIM-barrel fold metal-dependent hydrolase
MTDASITSSLGFALFDADNHYYEAADAFTRYLPKEYARRGISWIEMNGKPRLMAGKKLWRFIPNPTFDPIARPGALDAYFRGRNPKGQDVREAFGDLDAMADHPEYRDRDARLRVMDDQGVEGVFMFPTLGVGVEEALRSDVDAVHATFNAFNRWAGDDWGFSYQDRIYSAALISLLDERQALAELERVVEAGCRLICLRAAPIITPSGGRSPGDVVYDDFWTAVEDANVIVGIHSGDSGYDRYAVDWGASDEMEAFRADPFKRVMIGHRPIFDYLAAMITRGLFDRHPGVRVATIESGSSWVGELVKGLTKTYKQIPNLFPGDPIEAFRRNIWVSPFFEDDIRSLTDHVELDHLLMGSDWPHAEGLPEPTDYVKDLDGFSDDEIRMVMHDNARALLGG